MWYMLVLYIYISDTLIYSHQKFQVPKMEGFLKLIAGYSGGRISLPYTSRIHTAYIGFRIPPFGWYLKSLVIQQGL